LIIPGGMTRSRKRGIGLATEWRVGAGAGADFTTLQAAFDAVAAGDSEPTRIHLEAGVYREKLNLSVGKTVHLVGEGALRTRIEWDDYANKLHGDGAPYGTFRTPSFTIAADDTVLQDLTIANTAGPRSQVGQAVALAVTGQRFFGSGLRLLGHQDTLFTGGSGHQYFRDCDIEGDVDFIFGPATAVFERCQVKSLGRGYITAASTPKEVDIGYLFWQCCLTGAGPASVYLGRPWRPYASVIFVETEMGDHILPQGWDNWRDEHNQETARYFEFGSFGLGAANARRPVWAHAYALAELPQRWQLREVLKHSGIGRFS